MLDQARADELMAMAKVFEDLSVIAIPRPGELLQRSLWSEDRREHFMLDVNHMKRRSSARLRKCSYQERWETVVVLVRLDVGGTPHTNPDGQEIPCPHLHEYREGFEDRWARAAPGGVFSRADDLETTLQEFLVFCNVQHAPRIQRGLF